MTLDTYLATWGRASGISPEPNSTKVVQVSSKQYVDLWGHMGEEQASQWRLFEYLKENKINTAKIPGFELIDAQTLMTDEQIKKLVPTEQSLREMNWDGMFEKPKL